jgi:hypothetical protein
MRYVLPVYSSSLGDDVGVGAKYLVYGLQYGVSAYGAAMGAPFLPSGEGPENFSMLVKGEYDR